MADPAYTWRADDGTVKLFLSGEWLMARVTPAFSGQSITAAGHHVRLSLHDDGIEQWDSMLMVFVMQCYRHCRENALELDVSGMPAAVSRLLKLATTVERESDDITDSRDEEAGGLKRQLTVLWSILPNSRDFIEFLGGFFWSVFRLTRGKAMARSKDIIYFLDQVGPRALGIITLTSVLVGMILAYLGSVQLRQFGAGIYVADLVAIGMTREMGALMTAVILAGRTGAAYAAQIGSMQVNEEVAALKTLGLSSMEFLVMPRMLALLLIMPLLCIYADVLGMVGGAIVATSLDVNWSQYIAQTREAIEPIDFITGFIKSIFFALLIGIAGCQAGMKCGRDANAVGLATTAAVVTALIYLIVMDAAFNILYDQLGV